MVHLLSQLEVQKLEVVQKEEELTAGRRELRREQEALQVARAQLETLEAQISESQEQLGRELEKSKDLEEERERLEGKVHWFIEQSGAREVSPVIDQCPHRPRIWYGGGVVRVLFLLHNLIKLSSYSKRRTSHSVTPPTAPKTGYSSRRVETFSPRAPLPLPAARGAQSTRF